MCNLAKERWQSCSRSKIYPYAKSSAIFLRVFSKKYQNIQNPRGTSGNKRDRTSIQTEKIQLKY